MRERAKKKTLLGIVGSGRGGSDQVQLFAPGNTQRISVYATKGGCAVSGVRPNYSLTRLGLSTRHRNTLDAFLTRPLLLFGTFHTLHLGQKKKVSLKNRLHSAKE